LRVTEGAPRTQRPYANRVRVLAGFLLVFLAVWLWSVWEPLGALSFGVGAVMVGNAPAASEERFMSWLFLLAALGVILDWLT